MPGMSGFDLLAHFPEIDFEIIFITAYVLSETRPGDKVGRFQRSLGVEPDLKLLPLYSSTLLPGKKVSDSPVKGLAPGAVPGF